MQIGHFVFRDIRKRLHVTAGCINAVVAFDDNHTHIGIFVHLFNDRANLLAPGVRNDVQRFAIQDQITDALIHIDIDAQAIEVFQYRSPLLGVVFLSHLSFPVTEPIESRC